MAELTDEILGMALENSWLRFFIAVHLSTNVTIIALLLVLIFR